MPKKRAKKSNSQNIVETYKLFHLLRQTADAIHRSREFELKKYGISPEQAAALVCIHSLDGQATPAELSRWLFREPNSITILLKRMHKLGLVERKPDTKRKNVIRLSLTQKGYDTYQQSIEFNAFTPIVDGLPQRKREQLWSLLQNIREKAFEELRLDINNYSGWLDKAVVVEHNHSDTEQRETVCVH